MTQDTKARATPSGGQVTVARCPATSHETRPGITR